MYKARWRSFGLARGPRRGAGSVAPARRSPGRRRPRAWPHPNSCATASACSGGSSTPNIYTTAWCRRKCRSLRPCAPVAADPISPEHVRLGHVIRRRRAERELSQERLAEETGLHRNYIGRVERGELNLPFNRVVLIARTLGLSMAELGECYDREQNTRKVKPLPASERPLKAPRGSEDERQTT